MTDEQLQVLRKCPVHLIEDENGMVQGNHQALVIALQGAIEALKFYSDPKQLETYGRDKGVDPSIYNMAVNTLAAIRR